jgi:RimJ/RimL family protein N-acetyltransferase
MKIILETERLLLVEFTPDDATFIIELLNSEGWLKYVGNRNINTTEDAIKYLQNGAIKNYSENGFGFWKVVLKNELIPIGMCGLVKREHLEHVDIGFAFLPQYFGKGYAYEAAAPTLQFGFDKGFKNISAITIPDNLKSIALIEKLGLKFEKRFFMSDDKDELMLFVS